MKILHTSDWHLGQNFKNRTREGEHRAFFEWLEKTIIDKKIDILIVAGDIFDTTNPPKYALTMYHDFLVKLTQTSCREIVIVAGNHDSIATIEMTKNFAKLLHIHIVASGEDIDETLLTIQNEGKIEAIICAVPFLRDKVLRDANITQDNQEIEEAFKEGIKNYYQNIYQKAVAISSEVPIIATGHFTTTGSSLKSDSEREIYIGKLSSVNSDILTPFDYVAMGHLHRAQKVGDNEYIRYSGSPIALSFSEYNQQKKVVIVTFDTKESKNIEILDIPSFKKMYRVEGNLVEIKEKIETIKDAQNRPFLDVILSDNSLLNLDINEFLQDSYEKGVDILSFKRKYSVEDKVLVQEDTQRLNQLDTLEVFKKRVALEENLVADDALQEKLIQEYKIIVEELLDEDN